MFSGSRVTVHWERVGSLNISETQPVAIIAQVKVPPDLVTYTEEVLSVKLDFLCSA